MSASQSNKSSSQVQRSSPLLEELVSCKHLFTMAAFRLPLLKWVWRGDTENSTASHRRESSPPAAHVPLCLHLSTMIERIHAYWGLKTKLLLMRERESPSHSSTFTSFSSALEPALSSVDRGATALAGTT